jgi:ParB-like chromosome segregation protein Spo0J
MKTLKLSEIVVDDSLQTRNEISQQTVADYYEVLREGGKFPPIVVYFDGEKYYLTDGRHRYQAHKTAGLATIEVEIIEGSKREAQLYAVGANDSHGLRRSAADKRKAVLIMLDDVEWSEWSDREIAKQCKVSQPFVSKVRKDIGAQRDEVKSNRNGQEVKVKVKENADTETGHQAVDEGFKHQELVDTIAQIQAEKDALQDKLAVASVTDDPEEKERLTETLDDLRNQIKALEAENRALKASLKIELEEKNQLIKQVRYWKQQATKGTK